MTDAAANKYRRRIALITGCAFHFFHDGIADGLAVFLPLWRCPESAGVRCVWAWGS